MTEFVDLCIDNEYEIGTSFPYVIRRKRDGFLPKEGVNGDAGYIQIGINGRNYLKHRLIAQQFIPNPDNLPQVDHINRNKNDYHISNLRWCDSRTNTLNRRGRGNIRYEYVDTLPIDVVQIILYKGWEFEGYFIDQENNIWFDNGEQYRKLHVDCRNTVSMWDINHISHNIGVRGLVREFL